MIILSRDQILLMHHALIERYGGIHGIRDEGLLNSALNAPFQTFDNKDLYPTIAEKAVRLGYGLVMNHPFHDGNKRIGALAMLIMLDLNNMVLRTSSVELAAAFLSVASGKLTNEGLLQWVLSRLE